MSTDSWDNLDKPKSRILYGGMVELFFDPGSHRYKAKIRDEDGEHDPVTVPTVTSICAMIDKSGPLSQWAANLAVDYLRKSFSQIPQITLGADEFTVRTEEARRWLDGASLGARTYHRQVSRQAAFTGSMAHAWIEEFLNYHIGKLITPSLKKPKPPADPEAANAVKAALDWMYSRFFVPLQVELRVYSYIHNYAGTTDCKGTVDDKLSIIDWKTSKTLHWEYYLQSAAYVQADAEESGEPAEERHIVRLDKTTGKHQSIKLGSPEQQLNDMVAFLSAKQLYHTQRRLWLTEALGQQDSLKNCTSEQLDNAIKT